VRTDSPGATTQAHPDCSDWLDRQTIATWHNAFMPFEVPVSEFGPCLDTMPSFVSRYIADREALDRHFVFPYSARRLSVLNEFLAAWAGALEELPFESFSVDDKVDWLLFRNLMARERRALAETAKRYEEMASLVPFAQDLMALEDSRRNVEFIDGEEAAHILHKASIAIERVECDNGRSDSVLYRAARLFEEIKEKLAYWFKFYHGYDPVFSWWCEKPFETLNSRMDGYIARLKELSGADDLKKIIGDPVGRDSLVADLESSYIPYTPEELMAIGQREMEWCQAELRRAALDMGLGEDWRAALERTKQGHEAPGHQPRLVKDLALEAIEYVERNDLLTVPDIARNGWRMEMMSPEAQRVNPFFLGGQNIVVSFPTNSMEHEQKLTSMRGNNRAFARATVHHELIPGHYMQSFYQERSRPYRNVFWTPFWTEGWTFHWEMHLWERGFPRTPEERVGMLFWRAHRCARVVFSIKFHLGETSPMDCVEMLVNEVGHERENAMGEVRRSFKGDYPPLYQAAYLIGGIQVHNLHRELVVSGKMSDREFHDRFLKSNCMPIPFVRALLTGAVVPRSDLPAWRFAD